MMRVGVFPWLVVGPIVVVAGCFEIGVVDVAPPDGGAAGSTSSSTTSGAGGVGGAGSSSGAGGMASSSSTGASSTSTSGSGGGLPGCPVVPDTSAMVLIDGVQKYCIDATEVSNTQYRTWLLKNPDMNTQMGDCGGNPFLPMSGEPPVDEKPVVNVDWCDAFAYCKANGKRLCGKIGGSTNAWADFAQPGKSQWFKACTKNGAQAFPYGATYDIPSCNVADAKPDGGSSSAWPVGSVATCEGGFPGIYDMSGNVWEWEDSCEVGDAGQPRCRRRGGSFTSDQNNVDCAVGGTLDMHSFGNNVGFRCCADLP